MELVPREQVVRRIRAENPWWLRERPPVLPTDIRPRAYFNPFMPLLLDRSVRRALVLMGPRRVGKTVMLHHAVQLLLFSRVDPRRICYISVDNPLYNGWGLEELLDCASEASEADFASEEAYVFFDEIQYLRDWERHLKSLVDTRPNVKFVVSGSAAAALRLKSSESGAGRFTEFLLPPLTFHEFLQLLGKTHLVSDTGKPGIDAVADIEGLNDAFVAYLNFGGYPEVALSETIRADPARFIKSDIIDKVLLRDLPGLYGIQDIPELNSLFTALAYNTAQEMSLDAISRTAGVAKNTIKKYIDYLESAYLLRVVHRIDRDGRRFQRATSFKVYLTNPSMRSALFAPIEPDDDAMGRMTETAIFSQWFHSNAPICYARWDKGEIDIVGLRANRNPHWAVEVKWSDRYCDSPRELAKCLTFCRANGLEKLTVTTRTRFHETVFEGVTIKFLPSALYCYAVGYHAVDAKKGVIGGTPTSVPTIE